MVSSAAIALSIVAAFLAAAIGLALYGVRNVRMDPQEYIVGGRSFGTVFLWVLMAGEIYTSFTFLGAAGWAYGLGAPAYYILAYGACAYVLGYFLLPAIWRVGKERSLLTSPDFFADRYGSSALGVAAGLIQFVALVPYVTLQLSGLQLLLRIAGYDTFDATVAVGAAFLLIAFFVLTAGLRGTAWASVVKDVLVLGAVAFAGVAIPIHFFGSWSATIDQVLRTHPHVLTLAAGSAAHGTIWYVSTVVLTSLGFFTSPQGMSSAYSARSEQALRRNAMLLPFYQVALLLMFFAGLAALLIVPGLKGSAVDQSFLLVVQRYYPPWIMGFVAAAGSLAALIPASALLLAAASIFSKNVLGPFGIATGDRARLLATRVLVVAVALLALWFWLAEQKTLVELILIYYSAITQFVPGVCAAFLWRRATAWGVFAGIAGGVGVAIVLTIRGVSPWGLNAGFAALCVNLALLLAVSLMTPARTPERAASSAAAVN